MPPTSRITNGKTNVNKNSNAGCRDIRNFFKQFAASPPKPAKASVEVLDGDGDKDGDGVHESTTASAATAKARETSDGVEAVRKEVMESSRANSEGEMARLGGDQARDVCATRAMPSSRGSTRGRSPTKTPGTDRYRDTPIGPPSGTKRKLKAVLIPSPRKSPRPSPPPSEVKIAHHFSPNGRSITPSMLNSPTSRPRRNCRASDDPELPKIQCSDSIAAVTESEPLQPLDAQPAPDSTSASSPLSVPSLLGDPGSPNMHSPTSTAVATPELQQSSDTHFTPVSTFHSPSAMAEPELQPYSSHTHPTMASRSPSPTPKARHEASLSNNSDHPAPAAGTTGSFLSISSQPSRSFNSSRLMVRNGRREVTNSDSEDEDSSDDDLPDIFITPKKSKQRSASPPSSPALPRPDFKATPRTASAPLNGPTRGASRSSKRAASGPQASSARRTRLNDTPKDTPRPALKYSMAELVRQAKQREAELAREKAAEEAFQAKQRERAECARKEKELEQQMQPDLGLLDVDGDSGTRQKLSSAVQRSWEMQEEKSFHLFDVSGCNRGVVWAAGEDLKFDWVFGPDELREACVTTLAANIAEQRKLPPELCQWMVGQMFADETPEQLCEAYVNILRICSERHGYSEVRSLDSCYSIRASESRTSAGSKGLNDDTNADAGRELPRGLKYVLRIIPDSLKAASPSLDQMTTTISQLALANIDGDVKANLLLRDEVAHAIEEIAGIPDEDSVSDFAARIHRHLSTQYDLSPELRCAVVSSFPADRPRSSSIRRWLALHLLTEGMSSEEIPVSLHSTRWVAVFVKVLEETSPFRKADKALKQTYSSNKGDATDYALLMAFTGVLDIAIHSGFGRTQSAASTNDGQRLSRAVARSSTSSPAPSTTLGKPAALLDVGIPTPAGATTATSNPLLPKSLSSSTTSASVSSTAGGNSTELFNTHIDILSLQIRQIAGRIAEGDITNIQRTQAKIALEALARRLELSVRTRRRPRSHTFQAESLVQGRLGGFVTKGQS